MVTEMKDARADLIANIRLYDENEGGRMTLTPSDKLGCILEYNGGNFDCFLLLDNIGALPPGFRGNVPIVLLYPDEIKNKLKVGAHFILKDYRKIGEGEILAIL